MDSKTKSILYFAAAGLLVGFIVAPKIASAIKKREDNGAGDEEGDTSNFRGGSRLPIYGTKGEIKSNVSSKHVKTRKGITTACYCWKNGVSYKAPCNTECK